MHLTGLDFGNSFVKARTAEGIEASIPHAIHQLTEAEYGNILTRSDGRPGPDYVRVNGVPYVVGESAEMHGVISNREGAARYTRDYYGIMAATILARLYERSGDVHLIGMHAPGDIIYRGDLVKSAGGYWNVDLNGHTFNFHIAKVTAFEEPTGGWAHVVLNDDGTKVLRSDVKEGHTLVLDIGGNTFDLQAIRPNGEVDLSLDISEKIGIIETVDQFSNSLRKMYAAEFKRTQTLRPERVRDALANGVFIGAGREYPCADIAAESTYTLVNRILDVYQRRAEGPSNWDSIILTGGGSAMLYNHLKDELGHNNIILAGEIEDAHMANVRGSLKLVRVWQWIERNDRKQN